jgi:cell division protein FtsI/penicillin-binding protein 2
MGYRYYIVLTLAVLMYGGLFWHLYQLQLNEGKYFAARAGNEVAADTAALSRATIYFTDKNGSRVPAATNKDFPEIYAVPAKIDDPAETAHAIASLLEIPVPQLLPGFKNKDSKYQLILKKAPDSAVTQLKSENIPGIYIQDTPARYYPFGSIASHVLGFVAPDESGGDKGRYGAERQFESELTGNPPQEVQLTLDPNIQAECERVLNDIVKQYAAKGGSIIVQEPFTGKILAMASNPTFNPNEYSISDLSDFPNPAVEKLYEPGSVIKIFTMAGALDAGRVTPQTSYVDTGSLLVSGHKIMNWDKKAYGLTTMTGVIEHSLNIGSAFAERQLGDEKFKQYFINFGFNAKTGIDLPGEVTADIRNLLKKDAPTVAFAAASFGQGVAMTPLHVITAASAIANGGLLMRPYVDANRQPSEIRRVVSKRAATEVTAMMVSAVDVNKLAAVHGYTVAGKTGTAQVPDLRHGGYFDDRYVNTYVGFAPSGKPRFTILIKLTEPEGAPLAGQTVVPAFQKLAQYLLNYYDVPPDRLDAKN